MMPRPGPRWRQLRGLVPARGRPATAYGSPAAAYGRPATARGIGLSRTSLAAAAAGAVMLAVPVIAVPAAWPVAVAGAAALLVAVPGRWPAAGRLAALAAVVTSGIGIAAGTVPLPLAAAEGTLVLAYLLVLDAAGSGLTGGRLRWARGHLPVLAAGFAAAVMTAVAAAAAVPASPWLVLAGAVAAGAALLVAAT
jgi:hypothetical protein